MRFYSCGNMYLSSIQQGIQAFHCLGEMIVGFGASIETKQAHIMNDWIKNHKTLICLNGGNNQSLTELYALLTREDNPGYPVAKFHEDEQSMGGMLTSVGVILPERMYDAVWVMPDEQYPAWEGGEGRWFVNDGLYPGTQFTGWEAEVLTAIKGMSLAR
jgi:hypothetical protein